MTLYLSISKNEQALAEKFVEVADALGEEAISRDGRFLISLTGEATLKPFYHVWAEQSRLDWNRVMIVFGDEWCVPPDDTRTNYHMIKEHLLERVFGEPQVLKMVRQPNDPARAAREYHAQLKEVLGADKKVHLSLFGLRPEGDTASLYANSSALREGSQFCAVTATPDGSATLLTLTMALYKRCHKIMFLASGREQAKGVANLLEGPLDPEALPCQFFLRDDRLNVNLLLDADAAGLLKKRG